MKLWPKVQIMLLASCLLCPGAVAGIVDADTAHVIDLEDVVVIASPKEQGKLRMQPASVTLLGRT